MAISENALPKAFHVMTKPSGPLCNLDCTYCFYLEKEKLYPGQTDWRMPEDVLQSYIRQYIEGQQSMEITFAWQGGEPTILGIDYFRRIVTLQQKYANGKRISNALQTNATLLDDEWGAFLAEHNFLVGVSIDGPEKIHDRYRVDRGHRPTFRKVMRGIECLQAQGAEFNTLSVLHRHNAKHPLDIYRFLKEIGSTYLQFIPIVERATEESEGEGLQLVLPDSVQAARVTPWSVRPDDFGEFLATIFDEWVRIDVGRIFVQYFDVALAAYAGHPPGLCVLSETCGDALAMEHNGDLYACDHFVYPQFRLGNILNSSITEMLASSQQRKFGADKRDTLAKYCRECEVRFACNGDCPKHRFSMTPDGEPGLSYLCPGYKRFFNHIKPYMEFMADELRQGRPPANIMAQIRQDELRAAGKTQPGPNDPCLCGSGRKYKKCCGRV